MQSLSIDIETYSSEDLSKTGVYKYVEAPDFEILLFGFSRDNDPVETIDLASGEKLPEDVLDVLTDDTVTKWAFNCSFERICISTYLRLNYPDRFRGYGDPEDTVHNYLNPAAWKCSMIWSAYLGLPLSLKDVGAVLGLEQQKMTEGKDLIRFFCSPCKPTKSNGGRTRNRPEDAPDKWSVFKSYNVRDVEVEQAIKRRLSHYLVPESVWEEYHIDQKINDRGILIDRALAKNAIRFDERSRAELTAELKDITHLENPNSVSQMKDWCAKNGLVTDTLGKKALAEHIRNTSGDLNTALQLRQKLAKSSVRKYQTMMDASCADSRARGMFQFYGANRSGRWAGRLIQLQNLPQNHLPDLDNARQLLRDGNYEAMTLLYDSIPSVLSELIRTAFIARPGYKFVVSDFSAIEARVLSWLASEKWRSEVFKNNGDIYCASASAMFHVPVVKHGVNGHLRQKGKIAELALGYGGGVGALKAMGALEMGLSEDELQPLVDSWRTSNPHIVQFWWQVDSAIKTAIKKRIPTKVAGIRFLVKSNMLFIFLPSGRMLSYVLPRIGVNDFGGESITYMGVGTARKWMRINSYGPKFVENITQAISRDVLCYAMRTLRDCFIVAHVHDELIIECPEDTSVAEICKKMGRTPEWAPGLVLRADGYDGHYYRKD